MAPLRSLGNTASIFDDFYGRTGKDAATNPFVHSYWFSLLSGNGSDDDEPYGIAVDSDNSVYVTGWAESHGFGGRDASIAKYDLFGVLQWQRTLGGSAADEGRGIAVDSSDNIYITGVTDNAGLIAKYNTSGVIQWQRKLGGSAQGYGIAIDSSDNVYICGSAGSNGILIAKYDSSGTIQGHRFLSGSGGGSDYGYGIAIDSSDNVYISGQTNNIGAGDYDLVIAKYNSSLQIQWQRILGDSVKEESTKHGIAVDSSGNVYVTGYSATSGNTTSLIVAKYNTSGSIQWQISLSTTNKAALGNSIEVDNSGNVYVGGSTNNTSSGQGYDILIAKLATSNGALIWQRTFGESSSEGAEDIFVKDNVVYACSLTGATRKHLITKLPANGSLTGTYNVTGGTFVYAASSLTHATSSFTDAESTLTDAAGNLTDAATSLVDQTSTFSSSTDPIE
tara:strand:- start:3086 stop:4432 length:1347 start_codon:yes stop_codon:yes gene_type:complete